MCSPGYTAQPAASPHRAYSAYYTTFLVISGCKNSAGHPSFIDSLIDYVHKKIVKFVGLFHKRRSFLPNDCCKNLYFAFVHSTISYGIEIYGNTFQTYLLIIEKTVNKILRILQCKRRRETHVIDLYKTYNTLPVSSLFKLHVLKFVHTFYHNKSKLPIVFHSYFKSNDSIHDHNTRHKSDYHIKTGIK